MSWLFNPADPHAALVRMGLSPGGVLYLFGDMSPSVPPLFLLRASVAGPGSGWGRVVDGLLASRPLSAGDVADPLNNSPFWFSEIAEAFGTSWRWEITFNVIEREFTAVPPGYTITLPPKTWAFWLLPQEPAAGGARVWYWSEAEDAHTPEVPLFWPARRNQVIANLVSPPRLYTDELISLSDVLIVEAAWP